MAKTNVTPAHMALDLLRNQISAADIQQLTEVERGQFGEICSHWASMAMIANRPAPWDGFKPSQAK